MWGVFRLALQAGTPLNMKTKRDGGYGGLYCFVEEIKLLLIRRKAHPYQNPV